MLLRSCRLVLGRRLCSSSSFLSSPAYTTAAATNATNFSPLLLAFLPPLLASQSSSSSSKVARSRGVKRRGSLSFCSRALDTEESPSTASDFSSYYSSPYLSVLIHCQKQDADALAEGLLCFGANSVSMDNVADSGHLDEICITSIFADGEDVAACVTNAASSIGLNYIPRYEVSEGKQCDWVAKVQEMYDSTKVTDGLWIVPKWRTPPDSRAINVIINPGLAFGTGEHPSTKLCLLFLQGIIKGGEQILDYGTGSGVLGIAALKMGAALSVGIDIDPQAVKSASQNASLSGIDPNKMPVYLVANKGSSSPFPFVSAEKPEELSRSDLELEPLRGKCDIVIANVLLNPLIELVEDIVGYAKPDGIVGVSGILSEQVPKLEEVYSKYLDNVSVSEMEGWACLRGNRKRPENFFGSRVASL